MTLQQVPGRITTGAPILSITGMARHRKRSTPKAGMTLQRVPGRVGTEVPIFHSLVGLDLEKDLRRKRE